MEEIRELMPHTEWCQEQSSSSQWFQALQCFNISSHSHLIGKHSARTLHTRRGAVDVATAAEIRTSPLVINVPPSSSNGLNIILPSLIHPCSLSLFSLTSSFSSFCPSSLFSFSAFSLLLLRSCRFLFIISFSLLLLRSCRFLFIISFSLLLLRSCRFLFIIS